MEFVELPLKILQMLLGATDKPVIDRSHWIRVGKLRPEDLTKRAKIWSDTANDVRELKELQARATLIMAKRDSLTTEWWNHIERTYGLPSKANIHISEGDGFILMEPTGPKDAA